MLDAFRLMLVFTLLDPIKMIVADLFIAVGKPEQIVQARTVQLVVLLGGLFMLGPHLDIAGVALAVDGMLVIGIAVLLWRSRSYVDFSLGRLLAAPISALLCGLVSASGVITLWGGDGSDWQTALGKIVIFSTMYGAILFALERRELSKMLLFVTSNVFGKSKSKMSDVTGSQS